MSVCVCAGEGAAVGVRPPGRVQEGKRPAIHGPGGRPGELRYAGPHKGTLSPACVVNSRVLAQGGGRSLLSPCCLAG